MYVGTGVGIELSQTKVWTAKKTDDLLREGVPKGLRGIEPLLSFWLCLQVSVSPHRTG